ncbi:MAG: ABC transporter ATP-binding protein [Halanaerobiales bacterium]|nr:ABC transporter ATP-binding protein [Halanaerobiales bacterium]
MAKISVNNLSFHYNQGIPVLKDLSFSLAEKSTAIIGQNGAGKTTLVKLLKGLLKPQKGDILINDKNTKEHTAAALAREIGLVFQNPSDQIFKNNVLEEVKFGPLNLDFEETKAEERARKAIERLGLSEIADENPYDLSLSERKLVTIASILAMEPQIIIFDEPAIGQDYRNIALIKKIIREEIESGKLVLTINHDMDFVAEVFERIIVLNQGKILADGPTAEVFAQKKILQKAHLEMPAVTALAQELGIRNQIFLNKKEFIQYFKDIEV